MRLFLIFLVTTAAAITARADYIVGVPAGYTGSTAPLVKIDPTNGTSSILNSVGLSSQSLAQNAAGELFISFFVGAASNGRIARINPATGAPEQVYSAVTLGAGSIRGLAFDKSDLLYGVVNRDDANFSPTLPDDLYRFDLVSQTTQLVGSLGFKNVQGLDVAPNGDFFAWDIEFGLLSVNSMTGLATDVNPGIDGTVGIQSIVFAPHGRLFGAGFGLFSIDPITGAFSPLGTPGDIDLRGIEWIVPEPTTAVILLGMIALTTRRFTFWQHEL
jgi:hypothetical protein